MPVTLKHIASNTARVTLWFGADSLEVVYFPLRITTEMISQMAGFAAMTSEAQVVKNLRGMAETLAAIVQSWDLLEDDGETVIPLTVDRIVQISPVIALLIIQAILADLRPEVIAPQPKNGVS